MDNLTRTGAAILAHRISEFWRAHGYRCFEAAAVPLGRFGQDGHWLYGVRSNLGPNGLPPLEPTLILALRDRRATVVKSMRRRVAA